ncbi:hypothetical protein MTO96_022017 [Rhipicephalus appendiculatus]
MLLQCSHSVAAVALIKGDNSTNITSDATEVVEDSRSTGCGACVGLALILELARGAKPHPGEKTSSRVKVRELRSHFVQVVAQKRVNAQSAYDKYHQPCRPPKPP